LENEEQAIFDETHQLIHHHKSHMPENLRGASNCPVGYTLHDTIWIILGTGECLEELVSCHEEITDVQAIISREGVEDTTHILTSMKEALLSNCKLKPVLNA